MATEKACRRCGVTKPLTEFHPHPTGRFGRRQNCKVCHRADVRSWKAANPERRRAELKRSAAKQAALHPDQIQGYKRLRSERLAKAPGPRFDPARADYVARRALYGGRCAYCSEKPATTLDHGIAVSRGGGNWASNIFPSCAGCNSQKRTRTLFKTFKPKRFGLGLDPKRLP